MEIKNKIIEKVDLKKLLKKKKLTLYQLAKLSMVDYGYLSRAEKGLISLSQKEWEKIKKVLD